MADKRITDLQLIAAVTSGLSIPGDNGTQTYRFTAAQLKDFILAAENVTLAALKNDILTGLTAVSAADDDYFPLVDTSDSNKTKKALISTFARNLYRSVTSYPATVASTDGTLKLSGSSGTTTVPTAVGITGKRYKFIHAGTSLTQVYTLATTSGQTIGGVASGSYALYTNGEVLEIESDGANWIILGRITDTGWVDAGACTITATTTNPTKAGTTVVDKIKWKRVGDSAFFEIAQKWTGAGTAGSGGYEWNLPANMTADPTISSNSLATVAEIAASLCGHSFIIVDGSTQANYMVHTCTTTKVGIWAPGTGRIGSGLLPLTNSGIGYGLNFRLKIAGWRP